MRSIIARERMCEFMQFSVSWTGSASLCVKFVLKAFPLLAFGSLAACSATTSGGGQYASRGGSEIDPRYGVRASPRVVADGEEVPRGGGRYQVGKPYQIAGKTYYPSEKPYSATGAASWYGADFHGRKTANGEVFDRNSVSAAHPTMPLPSYARVTNLRNAASIVVRVNDRGPYHGGRVMDVSQRVAEALDFARAGTANVKVEWLARASLAGSDDAKLLASLRQDGHPAVLEGFAPVMVASREEPIRTAALEKPSRAPAEPESDEAEPATTATTPKTLAVGATAPLPPARPFDLGAATASIAKARGKQALN